ncbi:MAG TPA: PaaI family thioesterase [Dehalococcoidia bacterium]|nr:PaaI family thioesterase [Dehalococcoidia bacterium]
MTPSDPKILESAKARAGANSYWRHLGIDVIDAGEGWIRLRLPVRDELRNAAGAPVHGGAIASLLDAAVGGALGTVHEASVGGVGQATLDLNITFVGAAREGEVYAEGRIIRKGGTIAFGEADVHDASGELLARGRVTYMLLRP